jgi:hypothetical protein
MNRECSWERSAAAEGVMLKEEELAPIKALSTMYFSPALLKKLRSALLPTIVGPGRWEAESHRAGLLE